MYSKKMPNSPPEPVSDHITPPPIGPKQTASGSDIPIVYCERAASTLTRSASKARNYLPCLRFGLVYKTDKCLVHGRSQYNLGRRRREAERDAERRDRHSHAERGNEDPRKKGGTVCPLPALSRERSRAWSIP